MRNKDPIKMIDIGQKEIIFRKAIAEGHIQLNKKTIRAIKEGRIKKGDPLAVAEISSIQAVKKTPDLIPLCHPIPINSVDTKFTFDDTKITVSCTVTANYKTGVEIEALTGVSIALLCIWDMVKYLEKNQEGQYPDTKIFGIRVIEKRKQNE